MKWGNWILIASIIIITVVSGLIANERDEFKAELFNMTTERDKLHNAFCSDYKRFDSCNGSRCQLIRPGEYPDYYCITCNKFTCTQEQMEQ